MRNESIADQISSRKELLTAALQQEVGELEARMAIARKIPRPSETELSKELISLCKEKREVERKAFGMGVPLDIGASDEDPFLNMVIRKFIADTEELELKTVDVLFEAAMKREEEEDRHQEELHKVLRELSDQGQITEKVYE